MKLLHLTLLFVILFSPFASGETNTLDTQDKLAVEKIVKNLANKLFLLTTTQDNSKKLQKELLKIMPDKIAAEGEYEPISKKKYTDRNIEIAIENENIIDKSIRKDVSPICKYIEDGSVDCDLQERIKYIEKADTIPQKAHEFEAGAEYKFNLKMNESGEWYINKMKTWNMIPAPKMSTLEIEKEFRKELKRIRSRVYDIDKDGPLPIRAISTSKLSRQKKTDVELAEEEAEKEEQERLFREFKEQAKVQNRSIIPRLRVDRNGNVIGYDVDEHINKLIQTCDTNNNDIVEYDEIKSLDEWSKFHKKDEIFCYLSEDEIKNIDKNNDQKMTKIEFLNAFKREFISIGFPMEQSEKEKVKMNLKEELEKMKNLPKNMQLNLLFSLCNENDDYRLSSIEAKDCKIDTDIFKNLDSDNNKYLDKNDILLQLKELKIFMEKHLD